MQAEQVFDKAASIRGELDEIKLIASEFQLINDVLYLDGHTRDLDKRVLDAVGEIQDAVAKIEDCAIALQEPDVTASLAERQLFLEILLGGRRDDMVHRTYVFEKIGYALQPGTTLGMLRGALDSSNRARFDASRERL